MVRYRTNTCARAAGHLQDAGLIRYSRGRITVLDRDKLEQRVCECYAVVKKEPDRLLPYLPPAGRAFVSTASSGLA
jgi:hypothetical protein